MDTDKDDILYRDITDDSAFMPSEESAIIKVVGVGGGGSNAVNYMYRQNIKHVNFVVCNTDEQALKISPVPNKLILGYDITKGLGAGNVPKVGQKCAEASTEEVKRLFRPPTEMVFVTAGMGGGTGTGAAPVIAQIAKESGMLTIGIVTIPFLFEGDTKVKKAIEGAREMQKHVDALLVINNENLVELYSDLTFFNAFEKADDTLANAARSISEIISEECYINVDFRDVQTTLRDAGTAIIATAEGEGEHRITDAIHNALHSPLLKAHDIKTSKRLLLKFSCNKNAEHALKMNEINEIRQFTSQLPAIDVKWGVADDPTLGDKVKITVLASGFDMTVKDKDPDGIITFEDPEEKKKNDARDEMTEQIKELYGEDKLRMQARDAAKVKYAVLKPSQFDDEEIIQILERTPTVKRTSRFNQELLGRTKTDQPAASRPESVAKSGSSSYSDPTTGDISF